MMQEAQLLHSLTHPNIVKYEGFIQTQHHMNIVLEFVENGSLLNTLKSFGNALPEHLVASYCRHILEGLAYLHERDVVHCDLKAANILTTKAGHVKLSDFGVSLNLKLKSHEDDNLVSGTPFWSMFTLIWRALVYSQQSIFDSVTWGDWIKRSLSSIWYLVRIHVCFCLCKYTHHWTLFPSLQVTGLYSHWIVYWKATLCRFDHHDCHV